MPMRLADFILSDMEHILMEWEIFARGIAPGAKMEPLPLRDHAPDILRATARDMNSSQSEIQRSAKSKGHRPEERNPGGQSQRDEDGHEGEDGHGGETTDGALLDPSALNRASELHAIDRLGSGFDLLEVVSEYRALRASVLRLWRDSAPQPDERDLDDVTRFNESIDQSVTRAVSSYTQRVDQARDLFLAILSHDLRNPLNSIAMLAQLLQTQREFNSESVETASQISTNTGVMARMIGDLLDYTRTRLGAGMPVTPVPMDLAGLCRAVFEEYRSAHPNRLLRFSAEGDFNGAWDADRLRQAVSNLMGNAIQHGDEDFPVDLKLTAEASHVTIVVHNGGTPIPPGELPKIFHPLVRGSSAQHPKRNRPGSIGLGLYIAREVARSHGGTIDVTSTQEAGTAFTVRLPRHCLVKSGQPILDDKHVTTM